MTRPTILIGIGSGGLRSIEAAWKLSLEAPADSRPLIEYIYLETDKSNQPASPKIVMSPLTIDDIKASKQAVEQDYSCTTSWLNGQVFPDNVFSGAGGSPIVGRMTIWDKANRQKFVTNLQAALQNLRRTSLETPLVYVVCSFGGGTGSGIFLDMAYLIRETLSNQVELQGLFMIPNKGLPDRIIYSNTICCIKELDYYNDDTHGFPFQWDANPPKGYEPENSPYDLVQVISAAYDQSLSPVTYSQLHEEAGIFLYLNALGMYDIRRKSLVDASGNVIISKYTTFGLSAIHYPETDIKQIVANSFSAEMLGHIIDEAHYYDKEYQEFRDIPAATVKIRNRVRQQFDRQFVEILHTWCDQIKVVDSGEALTIDLHMKNIAKTLASGNYSYDEKRKMLFNYFRVGGDYYQQLKNLCDANASDQVILLIIDMLQKCLADYQNLNIAITELDAIEESLSGILNFWNANGYTSKPQEWEKNLKEYIVKDVLPMLFTFKILSEKENVYYDRVKFILLYGLAMHVFSEKLTNILGGIRGNNNTNNVPIVIKTTTQKLMPTKRKIEEFKDIITHVIDGHNPKFISCMQVKASLKTKLAKNNGNIEYIYPKGSLDETLSSVIGNYRIVYGQERFIKDIIGNDDLYTFLYSIASNNNISDVKSERDLYEKIVPVYVSQIETGQFSVSEAVTGGEYDDKIRLVEGKAMISHLPINPSGRNATFMEHKNIPHILAGYDGPAGTVISTINDKLSTDLHITDFMIADPDRNKFSHDGLNNWLVFYKEFGHMSDGRPFSLIDDLRDFNDFASCYNAELHGVGTNAEVFHTKRMPYISYNECHEQSEKYINVAISQARGLEFESAKQSYQHAAYWNMANPTPVNEAAQLTTSLKNESSQEQFDRYFSIADRYMAAHNYPKAREYYRRALNIEPNDANALGKIRELDSISRQINVLVNRGDQKCTNPDNGANVLYEKYIIGGDLLQKTNCIAVYNEVLASYKEAQELSKHDKNIQQKILNVERRIKSLINN